MFESSRARYLIGIMLNNGDPSGTQIFCLVMPCIYYGGVDSVDIEDASSFEAKRNDGNCSTKRRYWKFRATRSQPPKFPAGLEACDGYIVQKVTVNCEKSECAADGSCGKNKVQDSFSYFEAWYVGTGDKSPAERMYTDEAITPPDFVAPLSCGNYSQKGEVKFFCSSVTGDLGKPNAPGIWPKGLRFGNGVCDTSAGKLPATSQEPGWWGAATPTVTWGDDAKNVWSDRSLRSSFRSMNTEWDCCCKKLKNRGATTTSEP